MKIKMSLSTDKMTKAKQELIEYKKSITEKSKEAVRQLIDLGFEVCNATILEMDIYDEGNLANSVSSYFDETLNRGFIKVSCDYAVFVEFGTGTKGTATPYKGSAMAEIGYKYQDGTSYVTLSDGRIGWYYPAKDGTFKFTEGLPSRPFMFETAQQMRNGLNKTLRRVFKS